MHKLKLVLAMVLLLAQTVSATIFMPHVHALPSTSIVISQLQTGGTGTGTAGQEFVELYNNSLGDVDMTGWCVTYSSAADGTASTVGCVAAPDSSTKVWLKSGTYATFTSPDFETASSYKGDVSFSYVGGISGTAGHIRLLDSTKTEIDKLAWGTTAVHPETAAASVPAGGKSLLRKTTSPGKLQDTDANNSDFSVVTPALHTSGLYEITTIIDVCPNINGAQTTIPSGLIIDVNGNCVSPPPVDVCPNIGGLQTDVPSGFLHDTHGDCQHDVCLNIEGLQTTIPTGDESLDGINCTPIPLVSDRIDLTELLPNPAGSDTGNEFIELYNPNSHEVNITGYVLWVGPNFDKSYAVPDGTVLQPGQYVSFNNAILPFTLVNTSSRAKLIAAAGNVVSEVPLYTDPLDGESWASIDGFWQFTNQPTPAAANLASVYEDDSVAIGVTTTACPDGKYRNPLTNRCRNITTDAAVLAACSEDQYRSPDTGRCRKLVIAGIATPCKDGQYRSEETNRCRNIATASVAPAPCKPNQERNPDTNRCRNVVATAGNAGFAVEPVKQGAKAFVGWWALGGIGLLAVGYAGWEWRFEVMNFIRKMTHSFVRR